MALRLYDRNEVHVVTSEFDTEEPKTQFHIRTLTLSQRARCLEHAARLGDIARGDAALGARMHEMLPLALELWEMLVISVTMVGCDVPKKQGQFGLCVPKEWYDSTVGDFQVLMDVLAKGIAVNTLGAAEKKTPAGLDSGANACESSTVPNASVKVGRPPEGVAEKAALTMKTLTEGRCDNVR